MKRLYDRFWEWMDEQGTRHGRHAVAGVFGLAVLWFGLLLLWLLTWLSDALGWNQ